MCEVSAKKYSTIGSLELVKVFKFSDKIPAIPDKIFGTKWSNPVKLGRKKKDWYALLRVS